MVRLLVLVFVASAGAPALAQMQPEEAVVDPGHRAAFERHIAEGYDPPCSAVPSQVAIVYSGAPLRLPSDWSIEVQSGSGHGFALTFRRFTGHGDGVALEEVEWRGRDGSPSGRVRRAQLTEAACAPLIDAVRLLAAVEVKEVRTPRPMPDGRRVGGGWMSSADFFVVVRVLDAERRTLLERRFCGYPSSHRQLGYLPATAVARIAHEMLPGDADLHTLPVEQQRESHFVDAFARNLEAVTRDTDWWWVLEYSVEALGALGSPEAVPALEELRDRLSGKDRARRKIERLLDAPEHWLQGPPKVLSD